MADKPITVAEKLNKIDSDRLKENTEQIKELGKKIKSEEEELKKHL